MTIQDVALFIGTVVLLFVGFIVLAWIVFLAVVFALMALGHVLDRGQRVAQRLKRRG